MSALAMFCFVIRNASEAVHTSKHLRVKVTDHQLPLVRHVQLSLQVGQEVFGAEIYSSNHKAVAEAQKARQLQHSVGSGDILAMYDKAGR